MFMTAVCLCVYPFVECGKAPETVTNICNEDVLAMLEISKIDLYLPVYHGTEEEVLQKGIGHIPGSDLPVGGAGMHSLLAGHRGLPNAILFNRLNELKIGDEFTIYINQAQHVYEVCKISIIMPDDTAGLKRTEGKDYISLITCTPFGINTHRLVVTGERKENE